MSKFLILILSIASTTAFASQSIREYTAAYYYQSKDISLEKALQLCQKKMTEVSLALQTTEVDVYSSECRELYHSLPGDEVHGYSATFLLRFPGVTYIDEFELEVGPRCELEKDQILHRIRSAGISVIQSQCDKQALKLDYLFETGKDIAKLGKIMVYKNQEDCQSAISQVKASLANLNSSVIHARCADFEYNKTQLTSLQLYYISNNHYGQNTIMLEDLDEGQSCSNTAKNLANWSQQDEVEPVLTSCVYHGGKLQRQLTYLYEALDPVRSQMSAAYKDAAKCQQVREQVATAMEKDYQVLSSHCYKTNTKSYRYIIHYLNIYDFTRRLDQL
tara:strand:- start:19118 stop:20116 length:999 start_codon:yes stop_codon:yes gene_type:complete